MRQSLKALLTGLAGLIVACGGGTPVSPVELPAGGTITVRVSAGAPLEGVSVTVYAIDPYTGLPIEGRPGGSLLGSSSGSSVTGELKVTLNDDVTWDGPIQLVVTGTDVSYIDPTGEAGTSRVSLPDSFRMTSFVARYTTGTAVTAPVTLWTSLADAAALAYASGANPTSRTASPIEKALPLIDKLFSMHLSRPQAWDLRTSVPVRGDANVGSVRDVVFAALADLGLNQLARDISVTAGHPPGAVITAYQLLELLRADISDGLFDGRDGEAQLAARGGVYALTSRTTRFDLARALGAFLDGPANVTGLTRQSLESFSVFDNIALDRSLLYPANENPQDFDGLPPELELLAPLPEFVSEEALTVRVRAVDNAAGVARVRATVRGGVGEELVEGRRVEDHWELDLGIWRGQNTVLVWAEDAAVPTNSGREWSAPYSVSGRILRDDTQPAITPRGAHSYKSEAGAALKLVNNEPVVPGALVLTGPKLDLQNFITIEKTYVTSSWGAEHPTGEELEGSNPRNLPFRQFAVAFSGGELEAPLSDVTWRFEASDDGWASVHESEGAAIPSAIQDPGNRIFNVVFSRETIPLLSTTTARVVELKLFFSATDAAGNTTELGPYAQRYELLDTPLHFVLDDAYANREATNSIYAYFTNRALYGWLFNPINGDINTKDDKPARIGRIVVLNPWDVEMAVRQSSSPYFSLTETWENWTEPETGEMVEMDEKWFKRVENWASDRPVPAHSCRNDYGSVCGYNWGSTKHIRYDRWLGGGLVCRDGKSLPGTSWRTPANLTSNHLSARYVLREAGSEEFAERLKGDAAPSAVVPAASGSSPGRVVVFPGVDAEGLRREWHATWDDGPPGEHSQAAGIVYVEKGQGATCQTDGQPFPEALKRWEAETWRQRLLAAHSVLYGTGVAFQARPVYGTGDDRVETGPVPQGTTVPLSVNFNHRATP